jgi:glutamate carboxypeptidase
MSSDAQHGDAAAAAHVDGANRARAFAHIDAAAPSMIDTVQVWSRINSGSAELAGLRRMADALADAFSALPGPLARTPLPPTDRVRADGEIEARANGEALSVRVRPDAPIQVALTGHYDTVFPAASAFQTPRFLDADRLNGPGVADMKGGLLVMLEALKAFETTPYAAHVGYEALLSPDEETGSLASAPLLAALGARAHVGMTYEPALPDGSLAGARKGSGNFSLIVRGRSAHVGRAFADGRNAVAAAARFAVALDALNGARDGVSFNVGAIDGGGAVNVVPDRAVVRFNVRAPDDASRRWAEDALARLVANVAGEGLTADLHGGITRAPKPLTDAQRQVLGWTRAAGRDLGLEIAWAATGGVCEGNNLFAAGCANVDTLGVRGGAIHSDEEFALASSFAERAKLSFLLLSGFAEGRFDPRGLRA